MQPSFETTDGGLAVVDPIERHRYVLSTPEAVSPTPAAIEEFRFPVDAAVSVHTDAISLPSVISVHVRDGEGRALCKAEHFADEKLPAGEYSIELSAPVKLYVRVESAVTVSADAETMRLDFGDTTEVVVGARSHHDRPATTITTTTDPEDMMRAVSTFGSALKTTSPERSYPTLRGHPPTVEVGDSLELAGLEPPQTGVTIEVPPEYRAIFVVSPLAYYLGATVVPGEKPLLRTDTGFEYSLERPNFERTVETTLKQVFFLDCLTRTEGLYPVDLHERRALESVLELDFAALYDDPLADQLEAYLRVPFATIEEHLPEWKLTTHVEPVPGSVEMLPFVVDDLAVVRCGNPEEVPNPTKIVAFDGGTGIAEPRHGRDFTWGVRAGAAVETDATFVELEPAESLEQAWVGEGIPLGASKAIFEAYENRLGRTPAEGDIDITVICNDAEMDEERGIIDEIYGDRAELPFDVTVKSDLTTTELADVLSAETDFLHYVGHVDPEGFECADGKLDAATLDSVGVDAFLLNACESYQQGIALIKRGAIGGIVTLSEILNGEAVKMGQTLAALLNAGFPLRAALEIARGESIMGDEYIVVGDGGLAIAQTASGNPVMCKIKYKDDGLFSVEIQTFPTKNQGMGTLFTLHTENSEVYLSPTVIQISKIRQRELDELLSLENVPLRVNGKLRWSDQFDFSEL